MMRIGACLWLLMVPILACAKPPNVVLIVTDDQGWWDLGVHGNKTLDTPVLDKLASEGVRFSHFYVQPVCAPTRAGLMTGRHYLRTGVYNTRFGGDTMDDSEVTLAEILQKTGYRTGLFGKWHLGQHVRYRPTQQGFDEFLGLLHGHIERYDYPAPLWQNNERIEARGYITDLLTDGAIRFVRAHRARPFFCYLAYNVPHSPFIAGDAHALQKRGDALISKYLKRGVRLREARIYAMIERCDQNIGRLLAEIDTLKLRNNTVVLFMSDNGGIHGHFNAGLRGRKASVYEGGVRSPFLVRWPGHFPAGACVNAMTSHLDILPTVCELVGVSPTDHVSKKLDGRSILSLLRGGKGESPHRYLHFTWNRYQPRADRKGAVRGPRYKWANGQLFDLLKDPGEKHNLARRHPDIARKLHAEYLRWFKDVTRGRTYQPVPIEVGREDDNPVEIQASWAKLTGPRIHYTFRAYDWDSIDQWTSEKDQARWRLQVVQPGKYEVMLSYGASRASRGGRFRLALGKPVLEGTVESTLTPDVFIRRNLGTITLPKGPATLTVTPRVVKGKELMQLNRIWLRRLK